jgi:hypothetical protein
MMNTAVGILFRLRDRHVAQGRQLPVDLPDPITYLPRPTPGGMAGDHTRDPFMRAALSIANNA